MNNYHTSFPNISLVKLFLIFILTSIFFSCADENPGLVNPPSQAGTIRIRLLNFIGDGKSRQLEIGSIKTSVAADGNTSEAINPPADSGFISIYQSDTKEFKLFYKQKFSRGITYSYIALPSPDGKLNPKVVDTIITLTTSTSVQTNNYDSYLKFVNAFPDSTSSYSLILGCQNGTPIVSSLPYRAISSLQTVSSGKLSVSVLKQRMGDTAKPIGLFELNMEAGRQYAVLVHKAVNGSEELLFLDQTNNTGSAISILNPVQQKVTYLRAINLSSENILLKKLPNEVITSNASTDYVTGFVNLSACSSNNLDTISAYDIGGTNLLSEIKSSLMVGANYSVLVFDSALKKAAWMFLIPPPAKNENISNRAAIRFVNALYKSDTVHFSLGARTNPKAQRRLSSGETVTLGSKSISETLFLEKANDQNNVVVPLTAMSNESPSQLLFCTNFELAIGKRYLIIASNTASGYIKLALVEDESTSTAGPVEYITQGIFTQIVNGIAGTDTNKLSLSNVLFNLDYIYTETIATTIKQGQNSITINGKLMDFTADSGKRVLIIAAGDNNNPEILSFMDNPILASKSNTVFRFINASKDIPNLTVKFDSLSKKAIVAGLQYGKSSAPITENLSKRVSIVYADDAKPDTELLRVNEIQLNVGESKTIIFAGSRDKGYTLIVLQEF